MRATEPTRLPALGPQGEGWVIAQLIMYGVVTLTGLRGRRWAPGARSATRLAAVVAGAAGGALVLGGSASLGHSLTPNPRPKRGATLRDNGPYGLVRHPIYGGVLLSALAWSLWFSPAALGPTALTAAVLDLKSRREEAWLAKRYPSYARYRARVPKRFLPGMW